MRTREEVLDRVTHPTDRDIEALQLEVLLDIRDGLQAMNEQLAKRPAGTTKIIELLEAAAE